MEKYLGNHSKKIKTLNELREGEIYIVGRGKDAFIGFRMPNETHVRRDYEKGSMLLQDIDLYETRIANGKVVDERVERDSTLHLDNFLDIEIMGIFKPREESRLRKVVEEKLKDLVAETQ